MDVFLKMASVQMVLFLYMLVGFYCRKTDILNDLARDKFTDFTIKVTLPCMVFGSFLGEMNADALRQGAMALAVASVMALVALLCGKVLYRNIKPGEKSVLQYGTLVSNSGFAGLPLVEGTFGAQGLFIGSLYIIPTRILMWSAGISLFTTADSRKERIKKVLLNPSIIAVVVGLIWMIFDLPLPSFASTAIKGLGACASPIAMVLVGAILADVDIRKVFEPKAFYLVAVRQIFLPLIALVLLKLIHADPLLTGVSVSLTAMPIGSTTAILAQKYGADAQFASKCVFISTLTSLITVPMLTLLI